MSQKLCPTSFVTRVYTSEGSHLWEHPHKVIDFYLDSVLHLTLPVVLCALVCVFTCTCSISLF